MNSNLFTVSFTERTITGSASAFKKASKGTGVAYDELVRLTTQHPTFELVKIECKAKRTYKGFNEDFAFYYVTMKGDEKAKATMTNIITFAKNNNTKPLPLLKSWLIETYRYEYVDEVFNMSKALEEVQEWRIEQIASGKKLPENPIHHSKKSGNSSTDPKPQMDEEIKAG